jgi:hypothetical protein
MKTQILYKKVFNCFRKLITPMLLKIFWDEYLFGIFLTLFIKN